MERAERIFKTASYLVAGAVILSGLYISSRYDYLLFHTLVELFSVLTAFVIFALAWHTRKIHDNHYLLFLGIASLCTGALDLAHTLTYKGMGVFPGQGANPATQFWIAFRFVFSVSFLLSTFYINKKLHPRTTLLLYALAFCVLTAAIFLGWFPDCYRDGTGLTAFKISAEYIISAIFLGALILLVRKRSAFDPLVFRLMALSLLFSIAAEVSFTEYASVYGFANMMGHLFLLTSVVLIYRAIVVTGVVEPSRLLFRNLKQSEETIRASETKYRLLFENMSNAFAYHRIVTDERGKPVDYVFLQINDVFVKMTGLNRTDIIGKGVREVLPGIEADPADWIGKYGRVALESREERFEQYAAPLGKWYSVLAYSPVREYFVTVFEDITERKRANDALFRKNREIALANRILEVFVKETGNDMYDKVLELVLARMESTYGVFGYIDEQGVLVCPTMSRIFDQCEMEGKCIHYPRNKWKGLWGRALLEKRTLFANEPPSVPKGHVSITNNMATPILFQNTVIGLFNLANKATGYTDEDRNFLESVTERIAPVLYAWIQKEMRENERKRAEDAVQKSLGRFELLAGTAGELLQALEPKKTMNSLCRKVMEHLGCDVFFNFLANEQAGRLRLNAFSGISEEQARQIEWLDYGSTVCGCAAREGCRIVTEHIPETIDPRTDLIKGYGIKAYACHPILGLKGKVMGTLSFGTRGRDAFSEDELSLMKAVTDQVAVAMIRIRDEEALRQAEKLSSALNEINTVIHSTLDHNQMMKKVIAHAAEAIGSESAAISFRKNGKWVITQSCGFPEEIVGLELNDDEERHTVLAVKTGKLLAIQDAYNDDRVNRDHMKKYGVRAVLVLPLVVENSPVGVIFFNYHSSTVEFTVAQLDFANKLAASVSLAIENVRLFAEMENRVAARTGELARANEELGQEIAVRRETERRVSLTNELLKLYTRKFSRKEYLDVAVELIRDWSGCRYAGVRIADRDGSIPFESCTGYSPEFLSSEGVLSMKHDQCICIRVSAGEREPSDLIAMTPTGSVYSNESIRFVDHLNGVQKARYRTVCTRYGFKSIAVVPIRHRDAILGAIHIADEREGMVPLKNVEFMEQLAFIIGEALFRFSVEEDLVCQREELARMNEQLRNLSAHIDAVREGERTSIAREIHDELGQVLTAIKMDVSWLGKRLPRKQAVLAEKTGETLQLIDSAIQSVKRISAELRPGILDDIGLAAAIEWACKEFSVRTGILCTVSIRPENLGVDRVRSTALFRILQESLTNIMRHAEASRVSVSLEERDRKLLLTVKDNGRGIKKEEISGGHAFGLIGMRERVQFLGGTISISGAHNRGTSVDVALPVDSTKGPKQND